MTASNEELFRYRWMAVCRGLNGDPFVRSYSDSAGVAIIPLNGRGEVLLAVEPAVSTGEPVLCLPTGTGEVGETVFETANRELQEELGYKAARLDELAELRPLARHGDWAVHIVLARELSPSRLQGDEKHAIGVEAVPLDRFEELIDAARLHDSTAIAALCLARRFLANTPA